MDINLIISQFSYLGIFALMTLNGIINIPSSQLLYLITGYFIGTKTLDPSLVIISGALGNTLGNMITVFLVRKHGTSLAGKLLGLNQEAFEKLHSTLEKVFKKKGLWYLFLGKITPSIKAFIPILAGLARVNPITASFIFLTSSVLWACGINGIGYYFGKNVSLQSFALFSFLIGGTILFFAYRSFKKEHQ